MPASLRQTYTNSSVATAHDPAFEVGFAEDDAANPRHWSKLYRGTILAVMSYGTTASVMFSTSYTSAIPGLQTSFDVSENIGILGVTTYLLGTAVGALVLAPLSEMYGRRPVYVVANALFVVWVIPCAVANDISTILVSRFFAAFCAAAMISNAPGSVNDITEEENRALAFSIWSIGPMNGPVIGPVVGGFIFQYLGWRWTNWVVVIAASVAWVCTSLVGETYAPAILRKRAAKKRKATGDERWWSRYDDKSKLLDLLKVNLSRPFVMTATEPICIFWDIYIALVYGCLYLCFVAYPIVFSDVRHWTPGLSGLAFAGIGVGSMILICGEPLIRSMINAHKPDPGSETGKPPPEAMVSVVCIAAILIPVGEIWFAWTGTPVSIPWIVPILAGIPFGAGNCAVFIYATNYLVDSYDVYAASALAGNALLRSVMGAVMPLAGEAMYTSLGPRWAGTLLALLEAVFIPVPFLFYRYGSKIRSKSALIRSMREDREKHSAKRRKAEERALRRARAEVEAAGGMMGVAAMDEQLDRAGDLEKASVLAFAISWPCA
ncbi:MFS general substrate transporter [Teratosphaeria nubilosa]|uniref:Cercosporin MFS transporter CTB4 n=1 Tax=Teratosphaeria nubilosa TaxID=161662 RepID=A0A6G1LAH0_9PEZI|nr:MFS general substrate transporter [Teratosphaeria nubilosa]